MEKVVESAAAELMTEELICGCRRLLLLGRGLKKLFRNRSGGFWLPDGTEDVGFRREALALRCVSRQRLWLCVLLQLDCSARA